MPRLTKIDPREISDEGLRKLRFLTVERLIDSAPTLGK